MNQPVTITFVPQLLFTWLVIIMVAGGLAGVLVRGGRASVLGSLIAGMLGGIFGVALVTGAAIPISEILQEGITIRYIDFIVVFGGSLMVYLIDRVIRRRPPPGGDE